MAMETLWQALINRRNSESVIRNSRQVTIYQTAPDKFDPVAKFGTTAAFAEDLQRGVKGLRAFAQSRLSARLDA